MFVYLAQPIDQARDVSLLKRISLVVSTTLNHQGHSIFKPHRAFALGMHVYRMDIDGEKVGSINAPTSEDLTTVDEINQAALGYCDAVVALLPPGVPTLGVPAEIELALSLNKPVCLVTTRELVYKSVQVTGWVNRGASVALVDPIDGRLTDDVPWAERLGSLPNPTLLVPYRVGWSPDLLVSGETANLQAGKYEGDAGLDLAINRDVSIGPAGSPGDRHLVTTGVHVAVPIGYFGLITGRSSTYAKHRVRVVQGVIDAGYRGELFISLVNEHESGWTFEKGTRLAQFILLPTFAGGLHIVPELPESTRGHAGFGSSGA